MEDNYNCVLNKEVFERLWDWRGLFVIDYCCSPHAIQRNPRTGLEPELVLPFLPDAIHRSSLTIVNSGKLYAFPPVPIIGQLIAHVLREKLKVVMVVPELPTQAWYAHVQCLDTLRLGGVGDLAHKVRARLGHPSGKGFERDRESVPMPAVAFNC